ncbi:cytochrome P450 [Jatrophihabitans sp. GAS493]|uniref:cytochrome P450 n=1 Tax=Jatrophihabitans sp. GAS493 TaxID=1907575 RepID=UPI000BB90C31|nr:cytochrome P450 [Jatrophihabitans sp. GAS493]SOD72149.1 cytochrome P450 [Jatrophihabitans sp. GAS493]
MTAIQPFKPFRTQHAFTTEEDISSPSFWAQTFDERDETFARLRGDAPVSWHPPFVDPLVPPEVHGEVGFWAVTRAADIKHVSMNNEQFSSQTLVEAATKPGSNEPSLTYYHPVPLKPQHPDLDQPPTFLEMDPPQHTQYRQAISRAFTPRYIRLMEEKIHKRAAEIVGRVAGAGDFDFVAEVSGRLPMLTIADMLGVPDSLSEDFARAANNFIGASDPDILPPGADPLAFTFEQITIVREIGIDLVHSRRKHPAEDVLSSLATYTVDGQPLSDDEISAMLLLLAVAGNDTTKQTTSHTALALDRNPEQRAWLAADFDARIGRSLDEFLRYASPVLEFGRMATEDVVLGGQQVSRGDKVVMFYCSGNRDESLFADPGRFDLQREQHPNVAFGGGGVHYCLGSNLAKMQLRAIFAELLTKLPGLGIGDPEYLASEFIHGIRKLPASA